VVSALAIHNLGEPAAIRRVVAEVAGLLGPGGCFFNLDLVLDVPFAAAGSALRELYARGAPEHHHHPGPDTEADHHALPAKPHRTDVGRPPVLAAGSGIR
jgi:hypothetical protein